MLSILIPVYNFNIQSLVNDLHQQCKDCNLDFEILCLDDGSTMAYKQRNKQIQRLPNVIYKELPSNLGRSKIRNKLAGLAKYPYLLFLDCDSKVVDDQYIRKYILHIHPLTLLYGGRVYAPTPPTQKGLCLHYYYGKNREEITSEEKEALLKEITERYDKQTTPYYAASRLWVDAIIKNHLTLMNL